MLQLDLGESVRPVRKGDVFPKEIQLLCRNATGRQQNQPTHANTSSVIQGYSYEEKARIRAFDIGIISLQTVIKNIQVARHSF